MKWLLYNLTTTVKSGGVETSVWHFGRALANRGHQVTLAGGESSRAQPPEADGLVVRTFPFTPRNKFPDLGSRARKFMERLSFARQALPWLKREDFDCVLLFKPYDLAPVFWGLRGRECRVGYFSEGSEFYPGFGPLARRLDYLGAVSAFNAAQVEAAGRGLKAPVNYMGVDSECFRPAAPDLELARRLGLEPGQPALVSAVRLVALKGLQYVLEAMALIAGQWPELRFLIAGEGDYRASLEARARELGLADRVAFAGFLPQENLASFYALGRAGGAAVFPSTGEESLGLSIAEAMACGLPVIASRIGGVPEVVGIEGRQEAGGLLVPPKDAQTLAAALERLLADGALRERLVKAGAERVARKFDWDAAAGRLESGFKAGAR